MIVSVIINPRAGSLKLELVKRKIADALFRCHLNFHICQDREDLGAFVKDQIELKTNVFLICGGDGTINSVLQFMLKNKLPDKELPPICLVSSGTANDLASSMDISQRIDRAARVILEGEEKKIDLIEVESHNEKKYMLTSGGIGIPALAADDANLFRGSLDSFCNDERLPDWGRKAGSLLQRSVKKAGSLIYSSTLLNAIKNWEQDTWGLDVEIPNERSFITSAPFILINNQPVVGKNFLTAPYAAHNDGQVNLTLIESKSALGQIEKLLRVIRGKLREGSDVKSFEVPEFRIKSRRNKRKITFFGDGEILFRDVDEVKVRCLKRSVGIMAKI